MNHGLSATAHHAGGSAFHRKPRNITGIQMPGRLLPEGDVHPSGDTVTIPVAAPVPAPPKTFTAEDIERARQQEKEKVYGRISEWQSKFEEQGKTLAELSAARDAEVAAAAEKARQEAEEAARKEWEEKGSKELIAQVKGEFENQFQQLQAEREQERAAFAKEQEFNALQNYVRETVTAAQAEGAIAPELAAFVTGNNKQEIDASLDFVKAKSAEIVNNIKVAQGQARAAMPGVSTAGYAVAGPMDTDSGTRTLSAADIQGMSMADYAKHRAALLPAASQAQQGRGLYG